MSGGLNPFCFVTGSRILTARGEVAVEDLQTGDQVVTLRDGVEILEPVIWLGYRSVDLKAQPDPGSAAPVRIRKDAIAEGQPTRDLLLSQDHSLFIGGKCVPVRLLVNGGSIAIDRSFREVTYYHVELARHSVLLAEGLPAESYMDAGNRDWFSNSDGPTALYPNFSAQPNADVWLTKGCAPLATGGDDLKLIWDRIAQRSVELGYAPTVVQTTEDAGIQLMVDGVAARRVDAGNGAYTFVVPAGARSVRLESRAAVPAYLGAPYLGGDYRTLGIQVVGITIRANNQETVIAMDDPRLTIGWNDPEQDRGSIWRWTTGSAELPWSDVSGPAVVTVMGSPHATYPVHEESLRLVA